MPHDEVAEGVEDEGVKHCEQDGRATIRSANAARRTSNTHRSDAAVSRAVSGICDIDLTWAVETGANNPAIDGPSIFTAVQEQLGLTLEPTRGPLEVLVIDQVEKPTPDQSEINENPAPLFADRERVAGKVHPRYGDTSDIGNSEALSQRARRSFRRRTLDTVCRHQRAPEHDLSLVYSVQQQSNGDTA